jgi:methylthioribose-1-phosphate isomerase
VIFHGIKVGFAKGKGIITWDDDEKVATLIQRHLPEQYEVLVKTTRKPLKTPLKELSVADLKKIGCTVEETADYVVISPVDSEVDKLVSAMLKDAIDSETASQN